MIQRPQFFIWEMVNTKLYKNILICFTLTGFNKRKLSKCMVIKSKKIHLNQKQIKSLKKWLKDIDQNKELDKLMLYRFYWIQWWDKYRLKKKKTLDESFLRKRIEKILLNLWRIMERQREQEHIRILILNLSRTSKDRKIIPEVQAIIILICTLRPSLNLQLSKKMKFQKN